jgi:MinD-like ATPase involved in chromosome partitioning or flagellar assembly
MFDQDQAAGMRALFRRERPDVVTAFGAGNSQAALLAALARSSVAEGSGVLVIDGSAGTMAQQFGLRCRYELGHVLAGDLALSQVIREVEPGLLLLPALRGIEQLSQVPAAISNRLRPQFSAMFDRKQAPIDTILINSRPLSVTHALTAFSAKAHLLLVLEPGLEGLTAAYQELKTLSMAHRIETCDVVLSGASRSGAASAMFERLKETAADFLGIGLTLQNRRGIDLTTLSDAGEKPARDNRSLLMESSRGLTC